MRYEDLEDTLKREPLWEPPVGFARTVVARTLTQNHPRPAIEHRPVFHVFRAAYLAVVAAALSYFGTWILWRLMPWVSDRAMTAADTYEMFLELAAGAAAANAMWVAWASAAWSLSVAAWFTRRAGVWI
jgi:hypothetical protein